MLREAYTKITRQAHGSFLRPHESALGEIRYGT